ncbi:isopropylmalate/homocitrate/citramalate synthase [Bradyrhizobium sp. BR 10261]|uniref:isopropylmalate/homocitrate/citramalate synthase n=1 Tax=Bradyrhizobium sp. BR 10261 TaxID=2749992 RepID=UPI001C64CB72|nr:isopropylmalate/homocitrate/citramalate synthase [Bradyrhizobium sp. BR 10261]MBW7967153.1 isopropylmalate/homocitrate/citramalate synthase [Bradyrhizobium sp. BR 10261]
MPDLIREAARSGVVVFHEEVARDGSQGKTLMLGQHRVSLAKRHSSILGANASRQLVFNAGFPSCGTEEFEAVRQVMSEVDCCYVGASGRATRDEAHLLLRAVEGARFGRVSVAVPTSVAMCATMLHKPPPACIDDAVAIVKILMDAGTASCVDFALVDATRSDVGFVADAASRLTEAGASMIIICDTVGALFPAESRRLFSQLVARASAEVTFVVHMHNDLGFGLANTLEALSCGIRGVTGSWLSLGERAGMPATEQLLFALGHEPERLPERMGIKADIWIERPNLRAIVPVARYVSQVTGREILVTDPIVGTGVNSISTGTPFVNPTLFQPYDPLSILGIGPTILLTPLASRRIVVAVASRLGCRLSSADVDRALSWVKSESFDRGVGVIDEADFAQFLEELGYPASSCASVQGPALLSAAVGNRTDHVERTGDRPSSANMAHRHVK